ncbi:MAG: flagellar biosynthesis anti-sigma factor FlgM [Clostridiales bacterium]|nr:flagellar biosynthesis anti-sigma factor FlgM [Clostridiales bacterium]
MKITGIGNVQGVMRPTEIAAKVRTEKPRGAVDAYEPTVLAGEFNLARRAILATPDIRTDRVDDVAGRIIAGDYNISAADLATRIMNQG